MKTIKRSKNDKLHKEIKEFLLKDRADKSKYKFKVVQDYLRRVYSGLCCYCESFFEHSASMNIEHFYPKDFKDKNGREIYENYRRVLCNLHYSCPKCNSLKNAVCPDWTESSNKKLKYWIKIYSPNFVLKDDVITDPVDKEDNFVPNGIEIENQFNFEKYEITPVDKNDNRAIWTIELFDLNWKKWRMYLLHERQRIYSYSIRKLDNINRLLSILKTGKYDEQIYGILDDYFHELSFIFKNNFPYSSMNRKLFLWLFNALISEYERIRRSS